MPISFVLVIFVAIFINILVVCVIRKTSSSTQEPEWKIDEGLSDYNEETAKTILRQFGEEQPISLPSGFIVADSIREFAEKYSSLDFDEYTRNFDREEFLKGECSLPFEKGFYCIGGDGGEISFYVRKAIDDEVVYAFSMETSSEITPYASDIRRFAVMRYNAWQTIRNAMQKQTVMQGK